jgi:hypothetical protein
MNKKDSERKRNGKYKNSEYEKELDTEFFTKGFQKTYIHLLPLS